MLPSFRVLLINAVLFFYKLVSYNRFFEIVSVHKVGYFVDRLCIFSPKGCENAVFKVVCL